VIGEHVRVVLEKDDRPGPGKNLSRAADDSAIVPIGIDFEEFCLAKSRVIGQEIIERAEGHLARGVLRDMAGSTRRPQRAEHLCSCFAEIIAHEGDIVELCGIGLKQIEIILVSFDAKNREFCFAPHDRQRIADVCSDVDRTEVWVFLKNCSANTTKVPAILGAVQLELREAV